MFVAYHPNSNLYLTKGEGAITHYWARLNSRVMSFGCTAEAVAIALRHLPEVLNGSVEAKLNSILKSK